MEAVRSNTVGSHLNVRWFNPSVYWLNLNHRKQILPMKDCKALLTFFFQNCKEKTKILITFLNKICHRTLD